jgi:hypothetical protein
MSARRARDAGCQSIWRGNFRTRSEGLKAVGLAAQPSMASVNDSFEIEPTSVSATGAHYLRLANQTNLATEAFEADSRRWNRSTSAAIITRANAVEAATLVRFIKELTSTRWPKRIAPLIRSLASANTLQLANIRTSP